MNDVMREDKKKYLKRMFNNIQGEDVGWTEYGDIQWFELRGYTYEEARQEVFNKYRAKLLNDNEITKTIVNYKDRYVVLKECFDDDFDDELDDEKIKERYINSLSNSFSAICDFDVVDKNLIDPKNVIGQIKETFIANEIVQGIKNENSYKSNPQQKDKTGFSVLEWGAVFFYANDIKALDVSDNTINKIKKFINKHSIDTTVGHLKNQYYNAGKRINDDDHYFPVEKLKNIVPFLKEHYPKAVKKVNNDIKYLQGKKG